MAFLRAKHSSLIASRRLRTRLAVVVSSLAIILAALVGLFNLVWGSLHGGNDQHLHSKLQEMLSETYHPQTSPNELTSNQKQQPTQVVPISRLQTPKWAARHANLTELAQNSKTATVVFLGDSITQHWNWKANDIWEMEFGRFGALNFGVSGDQTQHALWRLQNGEAGLLQPRGLIILIGTNNIARTSDPRNTPSEIIEGIVTFLNEACIKFPRARIVLMALLPRGSSNCAMRQAVLEVNRHLPNAIGNEALLQRNHACVNRPLRFVDIGPIFLDADDSIAWIMPDLLHPNRVGYELMARELRVHFQWLLSSSG